MIKIFLMMLIIVPIIFNQSKIITCKIISADKESRSVECPEFGIAKFTVDEWPKEWEDSTELNQEVKMLADKDSLVPFLSCAAREKLTEARLKTRRSEFKLPLQLPIDKDCQ